MRRAFIVPWVCAVSGFGVGCDPSTGELDSLPAQTAIVVQVVATVGGHAIGAADVRDRMTLDEIGAEAALDALVNEELLLQEAQRKGLSNEPEAVRRIDRVLVRAFLRDLEQENEPGDIPSDEVREDFEQNQEQLQVLERRGSWHVLAKADTPEAQEIATSVLAEARRATDPKTVFARYAATAADDADTPVVVEELPPITMNAAIEKPYKDALFGAKTLGPVREPVRTSYGWHAIVLTEILPGETHVLEDVEGDIRERLSRKKRFEKLVEVVQRLEAEELVEYDDPLVERLMTATDLPKRAE